MVPPDLIWAIIEDGSLPVHLQQGLKASIEGNHADNGVDTIFDENSYTFLDSACVAKVISFLPPPCIMTFRTCSNEVLQWAMQGPVAEAESLQQAHKQIRNGLSHRNVLRQLEQAQQKMEQDQQRMEERFQQTRDELWDRLQQERMERMESIESLRVQSYERMEQVEDQVQSLRDRLQQAQDEIESLRVQNRELAKATAAARQSLQGQNLFRSVQQLSPCSIPRPSLHATPAQTDSPTQESGQ